jgi:hypothetical protein
MAKSDAGRFTARKQQRRSGYAKSKKAAGFSAQRGTAWMSAKMKAARAGGIQKRKIMLDNMAKARAARSPTSPTGSPHAMPSSEEPRSRLTTSEEINLTTVLAAIAARTPKRTQGQAIPKEVAALTLRMVTMFRSLPSWTGSDNMLFSVVAKAVNLSRSSVAKIWRHSTV